MQKKVVFVRWQPFNAVATYIDISSICLVPHHKNPHTDSTIPYKLFQYMLMKKPVIVSNCRPLERIVNETGAGLVFKSNNENDLANKIRDIYQNSRDYGKNGYLSVLNKYNWKKETNSLVNIYNNKL